ncbi:hypothetical protein CWE12_00535 [Aliidiomarina sedimenti]|uniref:Uncharacterized protein n=1 Tax=Aliidiomarina sedimenti TaxID=1933879 RepID=A0ABY0C224_9GAMM|nr:hypothetical protein [Aliidiomarina sedimenti]RUO31525.1 hypothetical protein CWE12_00535 [Aliidiomarina sedimenti]
MQITRLVISPLLLAATYFAMPFTLAAEEDTTYQFDGRLEIDGHTVARPQQRIRTNEEQYVITQSESYPTIRLTYSISEAGGNLVNARFLIEQEGDSGWKTLMQPSLQAVLGQSQTITVSDNRSDEDDSADISFTFTVSESG